MMHSPHSKRAADRSVYKRRQGRGWLVVTWNERLQSWVEGPEMDYWKACSAVRLHKNSVRDGYMAGKLD